MIARCAVIRDSTLEPKPVRAIFRSPARPSPGTVNAERSRERLAGLLTALVECRCDGGVRDFSLVNVDRFGQGTAGIDGSFTADFC